MGELLRCEGCGQDELVRERERMHPMGMIWCPVMGQWARAEAMQGGKEGG